MVSDLKIYILEGCLGCERARRIARQVAIHVPKINVSVIDISRANSPVPPSVFAVPTYVLDGRTISLGNPDEVQFLALLNDLISEL